MKLLLTLKNGSVNQIKINKVKAACQINSKVEQQQQMPKKLHEMNNKKLL